ncbi:MAG: hypothetical protein EB078_13400 [Proteobacteria bacterium]|nr:hypothetical protein [Pseudomonadota bacterium]
MPPRPGLGQHPLHDAGIVGLDDPSEPIESGVVPHRGRDLQPAVDYVEPAVFQAVDAELRPRVVADDAARLAALPHQKAFGADAALVLWRHHVAAVDASVVARPHDDVYAAITHGERRIEERPAMVCRLNLDPLVVAWQELVETPRVPSPVPPHERLPLRRQRLGKEALARSAADVVLAHVVGVDRELVQVLDVTRGHACPYELTADLIAARSVALLFTAVITSAIVSDPVGPVGPITLVPPGHVPLAFGP